MTDNQPTPGYVNVGLPADTISVECNGATFLLVASGDDQMASHLCVHTDELGWYQFALTADTFKSLISQGAYFAGLTAEQTRQMAWNLNHTDSDDEPA